MPTLSIILYEKLKREHPEFFDVVEEEEVKNEAKDPLAVNNELLTKLNENIELMNSKLNKEKETIESL